MLSRITTGSASSIPSAVSAASCTTRRSTSSTPPRHPTARSFSSRSMTAMSGCTSDPIAPARSAGSRRAGGDRNGAAVPRASRSPTARSASRGREDPAARRRRARAILTRLAKAQPDWGPTLEFGSPFELLVATILAAQAQDEHINQVTRALFAKYRGPADYLKVPVEELERDIHATGFFRMKAKAIRGSSEQLLAEFGGEVPGDMEIGRAHV